MTNKRLYWFIDLELGSHIAQIEFIAVDEQFDMAKQQPFTPLVVGCMASSGRG